MKTEEGKEECTKGCSTILYISPHSVKKKVENSAVINKGILVAQVVAQLSQRIESKNFMGGNFDQGL